MDETKPEPSAPEPVGDGAYVVEQGECIYSIAAEAGHLWRTIWDHPQNESLRRARKDPGILLPGDRVFVPELRLKSIQLATGKRHRIVIDGETVPLRLRMCDADGEPLAQTTYRLLVEEQALMVTTDDDGCFEAQVPIGARTARLVEAANGETLVLQLGHMDPTDSPGGIRKRLANLGYDPEDTEGALDEHVGRLLDQLVEDAGRVGEATGDDILCRLEAREPWT